jgi:hypothetical protein
MDGITVRSSGWSSQIRQETSVTSGPAQKQVGVAWSLMDCTTPRCQRVIPIGECFPIAVLVGKKVSLILDPAKCHGEVFSSSPYGNNSCRVTRIRISLYDINYSHIHKFILMVYK